MTHMRWHCSKTTKRQRQGGRNTALCLGGDGSRKRRAPKATEAFSKLYYKDLILPVVAERSEGYVGPLIRLVTDVTKELYDAAVASNNVEVTSAVAAHILEAKRALKAEDDDDESESRTPEEYQE